MYIFDGFCWKKTLDIDLHSWIYFLAGGLVYIFIYNSFYQQWYLVFYIFTDFWWYSEITYWYVGWIKPHLTFFVFLFTTIKTNLRLLNIFYLRSRNFRPFFLSHQKSSENLLRGIKMEQLAKMDYWGFVFTCISFCVVPFLGMTLGNLVWRNFCKWNNIMRWISTNKKNKRKQKGQSNYNYLHFYWNTQKLLLKELNWNEVKVKQLLI